MVPGVCASPPEFGTPVSALAHPLETGPSTTSTQLPPVPQGAETLVRLRPVPARAAFQSAMAWSVGVFRSDIPAGTYTDTLVAGRWTVRVGPPMIHHAGWHFTTLRESVFNGELPGSMLQRSLVDHGLPTYLMLSLHRHQRAPSPRRCRTRLP